MKKINVPALLAKPFDAYRSNPMPFPGKYPTRWAISLEWTKDPRGMKSKGPLRKFIYQGKPNRAVANFMQNMQPGKNFGQVGIWEFDRGGAFQVCMLKLPVMGFNVTNKASVLKRFYYPWTSVCQISIVKPWEKRVRRVELTHKGKKWVVYHTDANGPVNENQALEHKQWLEKVSLG